MTLFYEFKRKHYRVIKDHKRQNESNKLMCIVQFKLYTTKIIVCYVGTCHVHKRYNILLPCNSIYSKHNFVWNVVLNKAPMFFTNKCILL